MTTHKSDAVQAGVKADYAKAGVVLCRSSKFVTEDDSIVSGDTIQMVPVPKNACVLALDLYYSDLPDGCTGTDVGYGGDSDAFMATIPVTGANFVRWPGSSYDNNTSDMFLHTFTADDTIDIALTSAPTKIPTSQQIYMAVYYKMVGTIGDEE